MSVTINANGLSIVHQGSGGEANASVPDVCLTQIGNSVVPIPYGNNAKSADLAEGTTTVFADGGNSIAIKGSKFSKSTGDAGGDKKGVSSGTTEAEAEFISASPTVIIEGKGVCRNSDQMTMNKANTMCFGVQNPSVVVAKDELGTDSVEVKCRYHNELLLKNAEFDITGLSGSVLASGKLNGSGEAVISGLTPGLVRIVVKESQDSFVTAPVLSPNPYFRSHFSDDDFFNLVVKRKRSFWLPKGFNDVGDCWGVMGKNLTADQNFIDMVRLETQAHFLSQHPDYNPELLAESIVSGVESLSEKSYTRLLDYGLPLLLEEGAILSVLSRLPEHETADRMLAYMRARGQGNPQTFLKEYDWDSAKKTLLTSIESLADKLQSRLKFMSSEAGRLKYAYLSDEVFEKHTSSLKTYKNSLTDGLTAAFNKLNKKADKLLGDVSEVHVIHAPMNTYATEPGYIDAVVNTLLTIDLDEQRWVKVRLIHSNRWQTPVYAENLKVTTNSVVHAEKAAVTALPAVSTESETIELAKETGKLEGGTAVFDDLKPNTETVTVEIVGEPGIEQQISDMQDGIEASLDGVYNALVEDMSGFQKTWDEDGFLTLGNGVIDGAKEWGADLVDMFSLSFWEDAGDTLSDVTSSTIDKVAIYSSKQYNSFVKAMEDEEGRLTNPTWVLQKVHEQLLDVGEGVYETIDDAVESAQELYGSSEDFLAKLQCVARHRTAILELPGKLAEGDVDAVEQFVDEVLMEFDPEWAKEIKYGENYPKALAVIQDHSSILTYLAYLALMLEAIPPNFYSYHMGKTGTYLALEIVLTLVLAVCTLGAGVAARISVITARLAAGAKKVKAVNHAVKALDTFIDTLKELVKVLEDLEKLSGKLVKRTGEKIKGSPNKTLTSRKAAVKRKGTCRLCSSDKHKTPRYKRGELQYI